MNIKIVLIATLVVIILALSANLYMQYRTPDASLAVTSFEECAAAGFPVMESMPRQCRDAAGNMFTEELQVMEETQLIDPTLTVTEAQEFAATGSCTEDGAVLAFETYNPNSGTWWFTLDAKRPGCSPACVVNDTTHESEVNWRCTGLQQ